MRGNYTRIFIVSLLIPIIGVFAIDYFSHLLFSNPMETIGYFLGKAALYFVFSFLFLSFSDLEKREFIKVAAAGITVSLLWGAYYNILPALFDFYPFGIALSGLTFLGMGLWGTGLAFGIVHILAFVGGYYLSKNILKIIAGAKVV